VIPPNQDVLNNNNSNNINEHNINTSTEKTTYPDWNEVKNRRNNSRLFRFAQQSKEGETIWKSIAEPFQEAEVKQAINSLKRRKAFGYDRIPAEILKANDECFAKTLTAHINDLYLNNAPLPKKWTEAVLCTLHKKKDKDNRDNYRPICLTSMGYKIITILITRRLSVVVNILTKDNQSAYKANRSCADPLFNVNMLINDATKKTGKSITLLDLSKAFDRTNRDLLYSILLRTGLPIETVRLIAHTHTNTILYPRERNLIGKPTKTNVGVFQGSPLSALLFIIYVGEMMEVYEEKVKTQITNKRRKTNKTWTQTTRCEKTEHEICFENFKEKVAKDFLEEKYTKCDIKPTKTITLEAIFEQYADDTQLLNMFKTKIIKKIKIYEEVADQYDILIQWEKTILLENKDKKNTTTLNAPFVFESCYCY
jgi:hypothetical protein